MDDARKITREEAINILHGIQADNLNLDNAHTKDKYEALDMAIKALKQEPCEGCEVGNPCLYCRHEFEPQESEDNE